MCSPESLRGIGDHATVLVRDITDFVSAFLFVEYLGYLCFLS